jgi:hypothetical protein
MKPSVSPSQIKVVSDFLSLDEIKEFVQIINKLEKEKPGHFSNWQNGKRLAMAFGNAEVDIYTTIYAQSTLESLGPEIRAKLYDLFSRIINKIAELYQTQKDMHMCSFWFAKQYPGATIPIHSDLDGENNSHFEYSVVLYLSTLKSGGVLCFPDLEYSYAPKAGDLVLFPTSGTGEHYVEEIPEERHSLVFWTTYDSKRELK